MSDEVVIIVPELTPGGGGVADYTLRLVEELSARIKPRFILPNETRNDLRAQLPQANGKVLLQYSAYGFDHFGYPRRLLRDLLDWKKSGGGLLVIMFHEIWAFWPLLNKNRFVQHFHRAAIGRLIAEADAVFTSTPSQAAHLLRLGPQRNIQSLPVGSNVRRTAQIDGPRENGLAILFGLQTARLKTLRKMRTLLPRSSIKKIITVGGGNTEAKNTEERALLEGFRLTNGFELQGAAAEAEISKLLGSAVFALSMQDELSITKSGTFMACAAHGLNIISPVADSVGAEPICWLTSPAELVEGISPNELKSRAENLLAWQERTASWQTIAERFAEALRL